MNVIAMRRNLTDGELEALKSVYPGESIEVFTIFPNSADEHLSACERLKPRLCFLPHEQPIPVPAMKAGFEHVLLIKGKLQRLVSIVPMFADFEG
jgi:hypothetical protein